MKPISIEMSLQYLIVSVVLISGGLYSGTNAVTGLIGSYVLV